jgi:hypothetical protein
VGPEGQNALCSHHPLLPASACRHHHGYCTSQQRPQCEHCTWLPHAWLPACFCVIAWGPHLKPTVPLHHVKQPEPPSQPCSQRCGWPSSLRVKLGLVHAALVREQCTFSRHHAVCVALRQGLPVRPRLLLNSWA